VLERLTKKVNQSQRDVICLFANPGVGKSSLAAEFPGACFVTDGRDKGFFDLVRNGLVKSAFDPIEAPDWQSLVDVTKALADPSTPLDCETIVFENLGGFQLHLGEKLINDEVSKTGKDRTLVTDKFFAYNSQGFKSGISDFSAWFRTACSITERVNNAGNSMRVILNGHTIAAKDKNVAGEVGEEFYRIDVDLHPEYLKILHRDCGAIGWLRQRPLVIKGEKGAVGRALTDDIREIVFHSSGNATAKNRWGITEAIPMGKSSKEAFKNLKTAIANAKARVAKASQTQTGEGK